MMMALVRGEKAPPQFVGIESPVGRVQFHQLAVGAAKQRVGMVVLVKRLENDDFVAGVGDGQQRGDHAFGGAAADGDFAFGIDFQAVGARVFCRDRVAERLRAPRDGVLIVIRRDGVDGGLFEIDGRGKIGKALRQIDGAVNRWRGASSRG